MSRYYISKSLLCHLTGPLKQFGVFYKYIVEKVLLVEVSNQLLRKSLSA